MQSDGDIFEELFEIFPPNFRSGSIIARPFHGVS
jgi:hypothetical protein